MRALFFSPHLDDVIFSCGATVAKMVFRGDDVVLATIFTGSVDSPRDFALACQTDKGLAPDVDYMALRRAEDERAAAALGVRSVLHLGLFEAPHRGYASAPALFAGVREDDVSPLPLRAILDEVGPDVVFVPQAIGNHVDHVRVTRAFIASGWAGAARFYRDAPYILRHFDATSTLNVGAGADTFEEVSPANLARKVVAASAYESQVGFQFGGNGLLEEALISLAKREGSLAGMAFAERTFDRG